MTKWELIAENGGDVAVFLAVLPFLFLLCFNCNLCYACGLAEYKIGTECCPMCGPGFHVYKHCTGQTSTSCAPCVGSTFTNNANGLDQCYRCTVCDQDLGLKPVKPCTPSSDTVCGALEGYYCINAYDGSCRAAQKHTACKPGQFIKQPGTVSTDTECKDCQENSYSDGSSVSCKPHTACQPGQFINHPGTKSRDTECEDCQENSYSNGTFTSCKPHTDCESIGLIAVKPGDRSSDFECRETSRHYYVLLLPFFSVIGIIVIFICIWQKKDLVI